MTSAATRLVDSAQCTDGSKSEVSSITEITSSVPEFESVRIRQQKLGLFGRDAQIATLKAAFDKVPESRTVTVLVSGSSGVGKTALVETLRKPVFDAGAYFVSGKFDQLRRTEPFAAIAPALSDLTELIMQSEERTALFRERLLRELGTEVTLLANLISSLSHLLGVQVEANDVRQIPQALTKLKMLCQQFLRLIDEPICLFLDDLQWCDNESLSLIEAVVKDPKATGILLVGTFRNEEMPPETLLAFGNFEEIHLENLAPDAVEEILTKMFNQDDMQDLAKLVHGKTHANAFHILQYLDELIVDKLLCHDVVRDRWVYDLDHIANTTNVSDNVFGLVSSKIHRLPKSVQALLVLAAHFGFRFYKDFLQQAIHSINQRVELMSQYGEFDESFETAFKEGLLEVAGRDGCYKFVHDRVQEVLYNQVGDATKKALIHLRLGQVAKERWNETDKYEDLFFAVDQLNRGSGLIADASEAMDLAYLNLSAAKASISQSAYGPAESYLRLGLDLLDDDAWNLNYGLSLDMKSTAAEVFSVRGDVAGCNRMVADVLERANRLEDKARVMITKVEVLGNVDRLIDAMKAASDFLVDLGVKLPKTPNESHVARTQTKVNKLMRAKNILSLPEMNDKEKLAALKLLNVYGMYAWLACDFNAVAITYQTMTIITLQHGRSEYAPKALSGYVMILICGGAIAKGCALMNKTKRMMEQYKSNLSEADFCFFHGLYSQQWREPLGKCLDTFNKGFEVGVREGEIQFGFYNALSYAVGATNSGRPLGGCINDVTNAAYQMNEFQQSTSLAILRPYLQMMLNLNGQSLNPTKLQGEAIPDYGMYMAQATAGDNAAAIQSVLLVELQLLYFFGSYLAAKERIKALRPLESNIVNHIEYAPLKLFSGLTYFMLYRKTRWYKYKRNARAMLRIVSKMAKEGNPNCVPMELILQAELSSFSPKATSQTLGKLTAAATSASDIGLVHYEALAYELSARHKEAIGQDPSADYENALVQYNRWNADAKVADVERKHSGAMDGDRRTKKAASGPFKIPTRALPWSIEYPS